MKAARFLAVCSAVVIAIPCRGQTAADPLTGTWNGEMRPADGGRQAKTVALKLAGKTVSGTVTGPTLQPGDVSGTFESGVLKMRVAVRGGNFTVDFDGKLDRGNIVGTVKSSEQSGTFSIAKGAAATTTPAATPASSRAQDGNAGVVAARQGFTQVHGWIMKAAELVPADKYNYRPVATVRTFGELIAHVADSYAYYCGRAAGKNVQWSDAIEKGAKDKATLTQKLKQAGDACTPVYGGAPQMGPLMENVAHTHLHYGNVITYMRMLGLTPPSS
jgi:hypothetical protein